jgi:carboxylesterase
MTQIIPTAEPFFFPGKGKKAAIGCLVQHGFTGAPKEMRWMGEYLNEQGYTVCGMRLTGHATKPEDMIRSRHTDWLADVEDGYHLLASSCEQVFLLGLSMGGILSLASAPSFQVKAGDPGRKVRGVVAMSTPYQLPDDPRIKYLKIISKFKPFMPKGKGEPGADWFDPQVFRQHVAYPENPVRSIAELYTLLGVMRASLAEIKVPVLLIHSRDDHYVIEASMDNIYAALGSTDKQKLWVEGGSHVITEEPTRHTVFQAAADFIRRVSGA